MFSGWTRRIPTAGRRSVPERDPRGGEQTGDRLHQFQGRDPLIQDHRDADYPGCHSRNAHPGLLHAGDGRSFPDQLRAVMRQWSFQHVPGLPGGGKPGGVRQMDCIQGGRRDKLRVNRFRGSFPPGHEEELNSRGRSESGIA